MHVSCWDPFSTALPSNLPPFRRSRSLYPESEPPPPLPEDKLLGSRRLYNLLWGPPGSGSGLRGAPWGGPWGQSSGSSGTPSSSTGAPSSSGAPSGGSSWPGSSGSEQQPGSGPQPGSGRQGGSSGVRIIPVE